MPAKSIAARMLISTVLLLTQSLFGQSPELFLTTGHSGPVNGVSVSADGAILATAGADNTVKIWDVASMRLLRTLSRHQADLFAVALSQDGSLLASSGYDRQVIIWDVQTGRVLKETQEHTQPVTALDFSRSGNLLATASRDSTVQIWDLNRDVLPRRLRGHTASINDVAFGPRDYLIASAGSDRQIFLWEASSGRLLKKLTGHRQAVNSVVFSKDGNFVASASDDGDLRIWSTATGQVLKALPQGAACQTVDFSDQGDFLLVGLKNGRIRPWDVPSWRPLADFSAHTRGVRSICAIPDGSRFVSSGRGGAIRIWDLKSDNALREVESHSLEITSMDGFGDDQIAVCATDDGHVLLVDLDSGQRLSTMQAHTGPIWSVRSSQDQRLFVTAGADGSARIWERSGGKSLKVLRGHQGPVYSAAFSADGRRVATAGHDKTIRIWDRFSGRNILTLEGHLARVWSVDTSPNAPLLASTSDDYTVRVWDSTSGQLLRTLRGHTALVRQACFSPDGRRIASASSDGTVRIWDARSAELLHVLVGHASSVKTVRYSLDGAVLASGGFDNTIRLWSAETGKPFQTLVGHQNDINALVFEAGRDRLASCGPEGVVRTWNLAKGIPEHQFAYLPDDNWISWPHNSVNYLGSRNAAKSGAIRFSQRLRDIAPLSDFAGRLKINDLRDAVPAREFARASDEVAGHSGARSTQLFWPLTICLIAVFAVTFYFFRRRTTGGDENISRFFSQAGFIHVKPISATVFELQSGNSDEPGLAVSWKNGDAVSEQQLTQMLSKNLKKHNLDAKLYLVHDGMDSILEKASRMRTQLRRRTIPISSAVLSRSLASDNCRELLKSLERSYLECNDPYLCSRQVQDPNWLFGRAELLDRLPAVLNRGQNVGVFGLPRVGLSSLALQLRNRHGDTPAVIIECGSLSPEADSYFREIVKQIYAQICSRGIVNPPDAMAIYKAKGFQESLLRLFDTWNTAGKFTPFLLVLDGLDTFFAKRRFIPRERSVTGYAHIFGTLQDLASSHKCLAILLTASRPEAIWPEELRQGEPMFSELQEEHIGFLTPDDSRQMLQQRGQWSGIHWEPEAASQVFHYCGGHPWVTQRFASEACQQGALRTVDLQRVDATADELRSTLRDNAIGQHFENELWPVLTPDEQKVVRLIGLRGKQGLLATAIPPERQAALLALEQFGMVGNDIGRLCLIPALLNDWLMQSQS